MTVVKDIDLAQGGESNLDLLLGFLSPVPAMFHKSVESLASEPMKVISNI